MNDIRLLLRIAARRLDATALLGRAHLVAIGAGLLIMCLLVAERLGAAPFVPWMWVLPGVALLAGLIALRMWLSGRRSDLQVAVAVDERLDLRERLSTAMHVQQRQDPFALAAVGDAVETARDARVREQVRRSFAVRAPDRWWLSPLVIAAAAGISFVPPLDLFAKEAAADPDVQKSIQDADVAMETVLDEIKESPQLAKEMSDLMDELGANPVHPDQLQTRSDVQRSALKKLTELNKRLDEVLNGPKGKTAEALERSLQQLRTPKDGPAKELADSLAKGDFKAAQEALQKLMEEAAGADKDKAAELAKQLKDLAEQLQQLAQQQQQLENALKQAGMDPALANNAAALQQAIQDNPNLDQQQKQQLQQMAQAQAAAQQMCQGLGGAMQQMAGQLQQMAQQGQMGQGQQGQPGQQGQQGQMQLQQMAQQMGQQLNQMEMMQQMLQQAQAAAKACQGQCQGQGQGLGMQQAMQQWMLKRGGAFGGPGQGAGGKAPRAPTPTKMNLEKANTKTLPGDIIARQFIEGPQMVGESTALMQDVAEVMREGYDAAQAEEQIPPRYRDAHQHYFGELKNRVPFAQDKPQPAPGAAPAPAPAGTPPAEKAKPGE